MPIKNIDSGSVRAPLSEPHSQNLSLEESAGYNRDIVHYIQHAAATGLYEIRGLGAKRHLPHFELSPIDQLDYD